MAGFDVPMVVHDMILRFMGVDLGAAATAGQHAQLPSSVGDDVREGIVIPPSSTDSATPATSSGVSDDDAARWEAYYNAGSAALVFILIALSIGLFFYFRSRRRQRQGVSLTRQAELDEETIPLSTQNGGLEDTSRQRKGKGKEQYDEASGEPIFDVGENDSDSEGERRYRDK